MKKASSADYLAYIAVKAVSKFLMVLPAGIIVLLGNTMGHIGYYFDRKHKSVAYNNIKIAFGNRYDIGDRKRMLKKLFVNFSLSMLELMRLSIIDKKYIDRFVDVQGRNYIDEAMKKGKGLIFIPVHFGSWEVSGAACSSAGHPYKIVVQEQHRNILIDDLLNSYRKSKEGITLARGSQTREIIRSLHNNEMLAMVMDQGGKDGMLVKFFGKTSSMHTGALRLALRYEVPLLLAFIIRQKGLHHKIILRPFGLDNSGDTQKDISTSLIRVIQQHESMISQYPDHYMWFYKVWKYSNDRTIIILSDTKAGHLRQSEAVAKILSDQLKERALNSQIKALEVKYKNNFSRFVVNLCCFFLRKSFFHMRIGFLKYFLTENSFKDIYGNYGEFIVSCGASASALNYILSGENKAKSIQILKPGILGFRRFDLVILPKHDLAPESNNAVQTEGALNLINKEYLDTQAGLLVNRFSFLKAGDKKRIGLFVGGDTKNYAITLETMGTLINEVKNAAERFDLEILSSTSRRTPKQADDLLKDKLNNYPRSKLCVIANENNFPEAAGGIFGLSQILLISSDSISMISEAASSGKTVVAFKIKPRANSRPNLRHQRFLGNLAQKGHIILVEPEEISRTIEAVISKKAKTFMLNDNLIVKEAIKKII